MATSNPKSILAFDQVEKQFSHDIFIRKAFKFSLDCAVPEDSCTVLLGHNGSGKTTAMRLALGLLRPDSGRVLFKGSALQPEDRRLIGYMPETDKLPLKLTAIDVLYLQISMMDPHLSWAAKRAKVLQTLEQALLLTQRNQRIGTLSKGMRRKLAWALASIHKPEVLILDEPFSGLDPLQRARMLDWIRKEREHHKTVIVSTHDFGFIRDLVDQIIVLKNGCMTLSTVDRLQEGDLLKYFERTEA